MTCTYDFRWRHIYVKSPITSGSHILDPQNPIFSFRHNFTKKYFFSKVRLIPDPDRSDLSKEPTKSGYWCKSAKKRFAVKTGPKRQVHYNLLLLLLVILCVINKPVDVSEGKDAGEHISGLSDRLGIVYAHLLHWFLVIPNQNTFNSSHRTRSFWTVYSPLFLKIIHGHKSSIWHKINFWLLGLTPKCNNSSC